MSKGSNRRPRLIGPKEEELRWNLAYGKITREEFENQNKKLTEMKQR